MNGWALAAILYVMAALHSAVLIATDLNGQRRHANPWRLLLSSVLWPLMFMYIWLGACWEYVRVRLPR